MAYKSEEETKKDIVDQMFWDPAVDATHIQVDLTGGKIILTGRVPSYFARQSAWKDAWLVSEGYSIDNRLTIEYPQELRVLTDSQLAEFVKSALFFNPVLNSADLEVKVRDRVVHITGVVNSFWHKQKIDAVVSDVKGIHEIRNEVRVVIPEKIPDEKIVGDISYAFLRSVGLDTGQVKVRVDNGRVFLTGSVADKVTYDAVEKIAAFTRGVTGLDNRLTIRGRGR